jgi:hypothetical protein
MCSQIFTNPTSEAYKMERQRVQHFTTHQILFELSGVPIMLGGIGEVDLVEAEKYKHRREILKIEYWQRRQAFYPGAV